MKFVFGFRVRLGNPDLDCQTHPYLQQYFLSLGTVLTKSFTGTFLFNSRVDVREVKTESIKELSGYFGMKF